MPKNKAISSAVSEPLAFSATPATIRTSHGLYPPMDQEIQPPAILTALAGYQAKKKSLTWPWKDSTQSCR